MWRHGTPRSETLHRPEHQSIVNIQGTSSRDHQLQQSAQNLDRSKCNAGGCSACERLGWWLKVGWIGAPPHFIARTMHCHTISDTRASLVFFCETSHLHGCYRRALIWGILVSSHIGRCFPTFSRSGRRPRLRWWKALQSALSRYKVGPNWDTMRFNERWKDFPSSVCDPVFCAGSGNPYDGNWRRHCGCPSVLTEMAGFCCQRQPRRLVRCRHAGQGDGREFEINSSSCVILFLKLVLCCSPRRLVCDLVERRWTAISRPLPWTLRSLLWRLV